MNRIVKVVILLLMLAIPIGIILFLHSFGRNEYTLPVFYKEGMKVCDTSTTFHTIPDFAFFSPMAGKITSEVLEEKISVVNFFEAGCKGECASVFDALANLQSDFATNEQVQIISISRGLVLKDTLLAFAQKYKSDTLKWMYLIEKQGKVLNLAKCGFGLDEISTQRSLETVVLVDEQKRIRGYYNIADAKEADRLVLEIRILLHGLKT